MLSEKIRELRRKSGLSQEELADKLDVSRQAVSKWETGAAVPTTDTLVDLADLFSVSLDYLLRDGTTEISPAPVTSKKYPKARKILGISFIAAAIISAVLMTILQLTGNGGDTAASSTITLDGTGIVIGLSVISAVVGTAFLISLKK